ncbi:hypothetical protein [uncultured Pseudomonas sp.]|uniref:hypothetical protein n=1 Tax=uncultured Pseudomonas sp. TaxID=114707 RepID=UPI0025D2F555|nr:hypothetical protein [uncultured Pseudomonas sp.]
MRVTQPSGSGKKATTPDANQLAITNVGAALVAFLVQKSPDARARLEQAASQADLTGNDATVVAELLARPVH